MIAVCPHVAQPTQMNGGAFETPTSLVSTLPHFGHGGVSGRDVPGDAGRGGLGVITDVDVPWGEPR